MSLLASVILFVLSVGSVRGFALYLGLTTVTNLIVYAMFAGRRSCC
jgi:preprotein translocase subunit SecD